MILNKNEIIPIWYLLAKNCGETTKFASEPVFDPLCTVCCSK